MLCMILIHLFSSIIFFDLLSTIITALKQCVIFKHKQQTKHYLKHHSQ